LNIADEKQLWIRFKEKDDQAAREALIVRHIRIVKYIAGRMAIHVPPTVEMNDLIGWGMLGLMDAVEKFDHRQDIKFTTYASIRVRGAIIDQIRSLDWAPRSLRSLARRIGSAREKLRHLNTHEPNTEEIAAELDVPPELVDETCAQVQTAQILSLDDYIPAEDSAEVQNPEQAAQQRERQEYLVHAILQLPDQQQKVLNLYYYEELTLKEIGVVLDVSESRICQIHSAAMKQLRKMVQGGI
jgi:RNA polymerase sigma factor for flagellar operon FliA